MRCINPSCNYPKTSVKNSRRMYEGRMHRRRHFCHKCNTRYTTYETILSDGGTAPHWFDF
ncbi:hypothetical protein [Rickettsiella endosymbiont of Dermanyssus gallinae]|uniref:NrdR family transcriptional regulator n=1 Tax=Rickettsiella endosymbiont of Dermanyssus gallinae TaxID=2856608 RepID=UPI003CCEBC60